MKRKWKAADSDYKFTEDEVRLYPIYKEQLIKAEKDIIHAAPLVDTNGGGRSNLPSRPTENIAFRLIDNARINHLVHYIRMIERAYLELDEEKRGFVERLYWSDPNIRLNRVAHEFNVSLATANRWRRAFLIRVATLTGVKRTPIGS